MDQPADGALEATPASLVSLRSRTGAALVGATVLASTVGSMSAYVVALAIPAISRSLHAGLTGVQWVVTGYLVALAALLLLSGALADRLGRRRVLAAGLVVMLVAALGCAAAPTTAALIAARMIQGAGAALTVPSSLALLNGTLRPSDRARGIGIWAGLATVGTTVSPFAGGWLVDHGSWRYAFVLDLPLIVAALWCLRAVPPIDTGSRSRTLDGVGAALAVIGLGGVVHALTGGPKSGWSSPLVVTTGCLGTACLIMLVPVERRQRDPMLRPTLFRSRQFTAINVATVLLYGAFTAASYLLALHCELRLGYSAAAAGAVLIPESLVFLMLSPVSGALVARFGPRWLMVAGSLTVAAAFAWLSLSHLGQPYPATILPATLLLGLGDGLVATPLTAAVLAAVDDADLGEAAAVNTAAEWVGGAVLVGLVPALVGAGARPLGPAIAGGYQLAMLVMAALCVAAAGVSARYVSNDAVTAALTAPAARVHTCALPDSAEMLR